MFDKYDVSHQKWRKPNICPLHKLVEIVIDINIIEFTFFVFISQGTVHCKIFLHHVERHVKQKKLIQKLNKSLRDLSVTLRPKISNVICLK